MIYDIRLKLSHTYAGTAAGGRHLMWLHPRDLPGRQRVVAWDLRADPVPTERSDQTDFFGNGTTSLGHDRTHSQMHIEMRTRIALTSPEPVLDITPPLPGLAAELAAIRALDGASPHHFLGTSPRVVGDADVTRWAAAQVSGGMTALQVLIALGEAIHRDMTFDAAATEVDTPLSEAFAKRRGVCQDFTHIQIAALRALGVPARYVSGFLRTEPPPGRPRLEGADAMHAWVSAWAGAEGGWIEYDPTNATLIGTDHIVVAYGRDYSDVPPIRGVLRAAGTGVGKQAVDVIPVEA